MRKQLIENAAYDVATQVRTVEDSIDAVLAELAELQGRMVRASGVMGIGPATGQQAFVQLGVTMQALISARGTMAQCHGELASAKQSVPGLRTVAFGDGDECPPPEAVTNLRVVA
jgi:hypothetical protein